MSTVLLSIFNLRSWKNFVKVKKRGKQGNHKRRAKIEEKFGGVQRIQHGKINLAVTVISVVVRQRVKYEQKSRHRYHVYANTLGEIDEQDVTAKTSDSLISLSLAFCIYTWSNPCSIGCVCTHTIRFHSFHMIRVASPLSQYTGRVPLRGIDFFRWLVIDYRSLLSTLIPPISVIVPVYPSLSCQNSM